MFSQYGHGLNFSCMSNKLRTVVIFKIQFPYIHYLHLVFHSMTMFDFTIIGPLMTKVMQPLLNFDLSTMPFMHTKLENVCGVELCRVTRCGYTGEDGIEVYIMKHFNN